MNQLLPLVQRSLYQQPRERFLYMYVTNECTLRCRHCYVGNDRLNRAELFDVPLAEHVLDHFRVTGGHDKLYILGGEPTLHPKLHEIVAAAKARGYSITISSNGDFDESVFDRIPPEVLDSINFSLESADPLIHKKIRGKHDNFAKVTSKIRSARRRGYQVRVMCTVSKVNRATALDLIPFVSELGAHTLSFHNLGRTGNAVKYLEPLSPAEWMDFCEELESTKPDPNLAVYYPPTFVQIEEQEKWAERGYPGCPARTLDRPHVYPDGTVYACPLMMDGQRHFARFIGGKLVLNASGANEMNAYLATDPICTGCSATQTCGGGCPAYAALPEYKEDWYSCDRKVTPLCILWTTWAWDRRPEEHIHDFR